MIGNQFSLPITYFITVSGKVEANRRSLDGLVDCDNWGKTLKRKLS